MNDWLIFGFMLVNLTVLPPINVSESIDTFETRFLRTGQRGEIPERTGRHAEYYIGSREGREYYK